MAKLTRLQQLLREQDRKVNGTPARKKTEFELPTTSQFRCMKPGCGETFTTQVACERHPHPRIECVLVQAETAR